MRTTLATFALVASLGSSLIACSDEAYDPDAPAIDPNAPIGAVAYALPVKK